MEAKTIEFTLFGADCRGNPKNTFYPHRYVIHSLDDFLKMADRDFVCAKYRNGHRDSDDFISADCVAMDCDNTHSDNPEDN